MPDPAAGYLVTCPSTSPENNFATDDEVISAVTMGSTMDNELLRNLFADYFSIFEKLSTGLAGEFEAICTLQRKHPAVKENQINYHSST